MNEVYSGAQERLVIPGDRIKNSGGLTAGSGILKTNEGLVATQLGRVMENNGVIFCKHLIQHISLDQGI